MLTRRWFAVLLVVLALVAAACGGRSDDDDASDDDDTAAADDDTADDDTADDDTADDDTAADDDTTTTTEAAAADPCEGVELEATEIGVTADTITVVAMADVENQFDPGLFEGAWVGVDAWAEHVNADGGLACRQVVVEQADSMLNPLETENGFLKACNEALALVGTTVLFGSGTADLNSCADQAGNAIGVPDLAYITTEPPHQCSPNSFHVSRPGGSCPYSGSGPRDYVAQVGTVKWVMDNVQPEPVGVFLIPADLPSTVASAAPQIAGHETLGVDYVDTVGVSGRATQAEYGPIVQTIRDSGVNFVYNGSNDQAMLKLRSEATAQGLDPESVTWVCSLSCYTPDFLDAGDVVEGTYVWMQFVPFAETDANPELADFIDAVGDPFPDAWAAGAWADGLMLEDVIAGIVEEAGPNGVTRQAVLDGLRGLASFNANGWWTDTDFTTTNTIGECIVVLQVQGGEYVRVFPEEAGTLDCSPDYRVAVTANPDEVEI